MFYDRQIRYLEYLENGEKIRTAGFVKIEAMDTLCNIQIQISGISVLYRLSREIWLNDGEKRALLGEITLLDGKGSLRMKGVPLTCLGEEGVSYADLKEISIALGKNRELVCRWKKGEPVLAAELPEKQSLPQEQPLPEAELPEGEMPEGRLLPSPDRLPETNQIVYDEEPENSPIACDTTEDASASYCPECPEMVAAQDDSSVPPYFYEDKWQQLSSIYPHVAPFRDERDYLSISPADFVVLQKQYHRLVTNSFLLHGYYSHEHLILTRTERKGQMRYYVGVPGNFYDKERQAAVMYGFECFECKEEPVKEGDFGYYCIRVDI